MVEEEEFLKTGFNFNIVYYISVNLVLIHLQQKLNISFIDGYLIPFFMGFILLYIVANASLHVRTHKVIIGRTMET
jgi:hypothetical protein